MFQAQIGTLVTTLIPESSDLRRASDGVAWPWEGEIKKDLKWTRTKFVRSHLILLSPVETCQACGVFPVFSVAPISLPPMWLLTFSSLHGWSGYWLDLGTQCTNTDKERERHQGRYSCSGHSTPLLFLQTHKKRKTQFFETPLPLSRHPDMVPKHW